MTVLNIILIYAASAVLAQYNYCNNRCSMTYDPVCGRTAENGIHTFRIYQNECTLLKFICEMTNKGIDMKKVPDELCNIKKEPMIIRSVRRQGVTDFSIVGAYHPCNHTCPTYCIDTYEPVCAQIWQTNMESSTLRPMINHCHVDLLSCALSVNVTINSIGKCYTNPSGLLFMSQIAALKSLNLLDDGIQ